MTSLHLKASYFFGILQKYHALIDFPPSNVPQVQNWFNTCAGTIYRARTIFLGGGGKLSPMPYQTLAPTKNGLRPKP